ncbi:MAG: hypothetical protein J6V15_02675 [Clostridia bacterium]|nr:hypothetical protein [Clostridia bacterium]
MTRDEKKEYLRRYMRINREIDRLLAEKERWKDLALKVTPTYSDMPKGSHSGADRVQNAIEKIDEIERMIDEKIDTLVDLRKEIEVILAQIRSERTRTILERRYIDGQTIEQIAAAEHLEERWVRRLCNKAIDKLTL